MQLNLGFLFLLGCHAVIFLNFSINIPVVVILPKVVITLICLLFLCPKLCQNLHAPMRCLGAAL